MSQERTGDERAGEGTGEGKGAGAGVGGAGDEGGGRELALRRATDGLPQVRRRRKGAWTAAKRRLFLDHLGATCNVSQSVEAVGMNLGGVYTLRRRDPAFRTEWADALECGYARLEAMLLSRAAGTDGARDGVEVGIAPGEPFDPGAHPQATAATDPVLALALLRLHRTTVSGGTRGGGRPVTKVDSDALADAILKQLSALNKRRGGQG